jgi:hypothetical protein
VRGAGGDTQLNVEKYCSEAPQEPPTVTVSEMRALASVPACYGKARDAWPQTMLDRVTPREAQGATFVGYVIHAKPEGLESSNRKFSAGRITTCTSTSAPA